MVTPCKFPMNAEYRREDARVRSISRAALDANGEAFAPCASATLPHAWTGGGGLAQKVGPPRRYLGPQNGLFTFVKHLKVARCTRPVRSTVI